MTTFQLDENLNSRKFATLCAKRGLAEVYRFPKDLRGSKDPEVLERFMSGANPLLTNDLAMPEQYCSIIPNQHPGIVILGWSPQGSRPWTVRSANDILDRLKDSVPDWQLLNCANSIVRISESFVEVSHLEDGTLKHDGVFEYGTEGWLEEFIGALGRNAALA